MKRGGGKQKGGAFERQVCVALSLWVTDDTREDVFWRSAMSGGRATVGHKKGKNLARQAGDICAVSPEGHRFCDQFFIECKAVKKLGLDQAMIKGTGPLMNFWKIACTQAEIHGKSPVLIAKQNGWPTLLIHTNNFGVSLNPFFDNGRWCVNYLLDLLERKYRGVMK